MSEITEEAEIKPRRGVAPVWVLPIVAALLGLWMLYYNTSNQGPVVTIEFKTAEGIQAGKTLIKSRNVELGVVETVVLADDLDSVIVTAQMQPAARKLIRQDSQFWVVTARVDASGVSGLGTVLSGSYIELAPGTSEDSRRNFKGLDAPPITEVGTPGVQVMLVSSRAGAVNTGDPVLYKGYTVGRVESSEFDLAADKMRYQVFIRAPYNELLRSTSRFFNRSGIDITANTQGFSVHAGSLQTLITGGVEFETLAEYGNGDAAHQDMTFTLYASSAEARQNPFRASTPYVIFFEQSLRGLNPGAPVEYRGITVGRVERIMLEEMVDQGIPAASRAIPVLVQLEPGRFFWADNEEGNAQVHDAVREGVADSLYATLQTGNLLTGQLVVALEFFPEEPPGAIREFEGMPTIPTQSSGLAQIEKKVVAVLDQIQGIPLADVGASARQSLDQLTATLQTASNTLDSLNRVLASDDTGNLPLELNRTLTELRTTLSGFNEGAPLYEQLDATVSDARRTLRAVEELVRALEAQPNSLIFAPARKADPQPGGDP